MNLPKELYPLVLGDKYPMFTLVNREIFKTHIPKITKITAIFGRPRGYDKNSRTMNLRLRLEKNGVSRKVRHSLPYKVSRGVVEYWTWEFEVPKKVSTISIGTEGKWAAFPHSFIGLGYREFESVCGTKNLEVSVEFVVNY